MGPEGYRIAFARGVDERYEREHGRDPLPDRAHSTPLDVALAGGLGALAVAGHDRRRGRRTRGGPSVTAGRGWPAGRRPGRPPGGRLFLFPTMELDPVAWLLAGLLVAATADPGRLRTWMAPPGRIGAVARRWVPGALVVLAGRRCWPAGHGWPPTGRRIGQPMRSPWHEAGAAAARPRHLVRPDVVRYHLLDARAREAAGEGTVAALGSVDDAVEISPRDPLAELARARLLVARAAATHVPAHARDARREVDGLLAADPLSGEAWLLAGELDRQADDAEATERAWRRAEQLLPRDPRPPTRLAVLYLATDRRGRGPPGGGPRPRRSTGTTPTRSRSVTAWSDRDGTDRDTWA